MRALPVAEGGLQAGDVVMAVAGVEVPEGNENGEFDAFLAQLPKQRVLDFDIVRDGTETTVKGPYLLPPYVSSVQPRSAAYRAGLKGGDVITGVDGTEIFSFAQLKTAVEASEGQPLDLKVWREGEALDFTLTARPVDEPQPDGSFARKTRIGIAGGMAFESATQTPGIGEALSINRSGQGAALFLPQLPQINAVFVGYLRRDSKE